VSASSRLRLTGRLAVTVAAAGVLASCGGTSSTTAHGGKTHHSEPVPPPAPYYSARLMNSSRVVSLRGLQGTPLLVTSFATWCVECRSELPQIQQLAARYAPKGLKVIGVSVDDGSDGASVAFATSLGVHFELLHDANHRYQIAFRAVGVPQSELIDRQGRMLQVWQGGFDTQSPQTTALIGRALR
jgi:peroxiredoxin